MRDSAGIEGNLLAAEKFRDPSTTANGDRRASAALSRLSTLWFNTGTLCNLTCGNCYIESSPRNDRLAYLGAGEVRDYLDQIEALGLGTEKIGFTGGEPFMNPEIIHMMDDTLARGYRVMVLTNAMKPLMKQADGLVELLQRYGTKLVLRVSLDHYSHALHEAERGEHSWKPALDGLKWLSASGFAVHVAGRTRWNEADAELRAGYARLFAEHAIPVDPADPVALVLFPEMDATLDVPEITEKCWGILGISPDAMMCATSRMIVKRKGAAHPVVMPCTLLPYGAVFEMGRNLSGAAGDVALNHPHCARFCVLGGGACSRN